MIDRELEKKVATIIERTVCNPRKPVSLIKAETIIDLVGASFEARIAALEGELELWLKWKSQFLPEQGCSIDRVSEYLNALDKEKAKVAALEERNKALVEALKKYGVHKYSCRLKESMPFYPDDKWTCDCGWKAALDAAEGEG